MKLQYDNEVCNRFVKEAEIAGFRVRHYHGRNFWQGPAVAIESNQCLGRYDDLIRATSVRLQSDTLDGVLIVYPHISGKLV